MKALVVLVLGVAAVGGYLYWAPSDDRGEIGDPVLSATPLVAPVEGEVQPLTDGTYILVASASSMQWSGMKTLIKDYVDRGTVNVSDGNVTVRDGVVASGSVVIDMTSIRTSSTGRGSGESTQERHLKGVDFFDVAAYPTSRFVLTDFNRNPDGSWQVGGTLTIRNATNPVSFGAVLAEQGDLLLLQAPEVSLDRTRWNIRYGSGTFFDNLGDSVIGDTFTVSFTAVGRLTD